MLRDLLARERLWVFISAAQVPLLGVLPSPLRSASAGLWLLGSPKRRKNLFLPIKCTRGWGKKAFPGGVKIMEPRDPAAGPLGKAEPFCPSQPSSAAIRVPPCTLPRRRGGFAPSLLVAEPAPSPSFSQAQRFPHVHPRLDSFCSC